MTPDRLSLAVVGGGAVGRLLVEELESAFADITVIDRRDPCREPSATTVLADATEPSDAAREALRGADVVVLALPEGAALAALPAIVPLLDSGALLVETLSVKSRFAAALRAAGASQQAVGINLMFRPAGRLSGEAVAAVELAEGPRARRFLSLLEERGARVWALEVDEHDRFMAGLQVAVHAAVMGFGLALRELGIDPGAARSFGPPPYRTVASLLARILGGAPEVYREVQVANPHAEEARAALRAGMERLGRATESRAAFDELFRELRDALGEGREELADQCEVLFRSLPQTRRAQVAARRRPEP